MMENRQMGVSLHFASAWLEDGWADDVRLHLHGGLIARIEKGVPAVPGDDAQALALPGLPNLHSHAFQRGFAGLAERRGPGMDSFWTWRERMYGFAGRIGPTELQAIAAMAYVEMLERGFTWVGEFHYLHRDPDGRVYSQPAEMCASIAAAAAQAGIGLTLLPVYYAQAGFGREASPEQRRFVSDPGSFAALLDDAGELRRYLPDLVLGVAPHSLRAVSAEDIPLIVALAPQGPVHIHIAEQRREVEDCLAAFGSRPVEWLLDNHPVDARWCLVHATHMTEAEAALLAATGAVAGLCPITEANLGDGLFAAGPFREAGGCWGIGSDSNVLIDPCEELRLLEYGQRLARQGRAIFADGPGRSTGEDMFAAALAGGARATGISAGLAEGASADIVSLDLAHPSLAGVEQGDLFDRWIFAAGHAAVDRVWRRGQLCVEGGRHLQREGVMRAYMRAIDSVLEAA